MNTQCDPGAAIIAATVHITQIIKPLTKTQVIGFQVSTASE